LRLFISYFYQVYSSSHFPESTLENGTRADRLFARPRLAGPSRFDCPLNEDEVLFDPAAAEPLTEAALQEKLQFFHVKGRRSEARQPGHFLSGLGSVPKSVASVDSLLLFNTSENP
jgi:hypothetical protein